MLGEKVGNLMIYVKQEELGDYEKIKQLVLKQCDYEKIKQLVLKKFQPTPRVLLNQFRRSQKLPNENYVQFASRIEAMFDYYCESRDIALKRLNALWTRLIRDPQYLKLYRDFIHEYEQLGHMKEVVVENDNSEIAYYMPHHGVLRPEKSTTKLRVVFNATNPTSNGLSLNSIQYNGGLVQNDLFTIMIKFREHPYAFTADVKMMYRMILIHESQQPLLRILWKESPEDPVKTFEMKTVTYGTVSAPFLATRTLLQLSRDEEKNFPLAAPVLRENFYMDDVLYGAASLMEAKALKNQLSGILKKGGMELHKWGSSHPELASNILGDYEFENPIETKTLGVS
ncbi:uncharacterized protein TNCV_4189941 [Trichonephila clavipes]|nr:uncharacterized protein TNCV_4189941 [Trichonephila clavipes]